MCNVEHGYGGEDELNSLRKGAQESVGVGSCTVWLETEVRRFPLTQCTPTQYQVSDLLNKPTI